MCVYRHPFLSFVTDYRFFVLLFLNYLIYISTTQEHERVRKLFLVVPPINWNIIGMYHRV